MPIMEPVQPPGMIQYVLNLVRSYPGNSVWISDMKADNVSLIFEVKYEGTAEQAALDLQDKIMLLLKDPGAVVVTSSNTP